MPVQFSRGQNGNILWAQEYTGPYAGLDSQSPPLLVADNASPALSNFLLRNKELRSLPRFIQKLPGANAGKIFGLASFLDINGTYHTVIFTLTGNFQYSPATLPFPWANVTGSAGIPGPTPVSYQTFANQLWYTNVSQFLGSTNPFLAYWDGIAAGFVAQQTFGDGSTARSVAGISLTDSPTVGGSLPGGPTVVGPLAIGAQYLGELNNQLILANVVVLDQNNGGATTTYKFPNLIWWSANGLPLQWDPTQNTSAGFNPFLDVPDEITGLATLGVAGYIFRTNGITQFAPSGNAVAPFTFDHMWASNQGIGCIYPWSISQYGPQCAFIARDNIYALSVTTAQPIGGTSRDAIMADLAAMPATVDSAPNVPFGFIAPVFNNGYVYLTYQIIINLGSVTRVYAYGFEQKSWEIWNLPLNPGTTSLVSATPNLV